MLPLLLVRDALGLLARIFVRQLHELDVVAALRPIDAHLFAEILLQKLCKQLRVLHLAWQEDLLRRAAARQIILLDQRRDRLLRRLRRRQDLIVLVQQVSVHKMQHGKAGLRLALIIADDVGVRHRPGRDKLLLAERLDGLQPVAQHRRLLKFQPLRRGLHPFAGCPPPRPDTSLPASAPSAAFWPGIPPGRARAGTRRRSAPCDSSGTAAPCRGRAGSACCSRGSFIARRSVSSMCCVTYRPPNGPKYRAPSFGALFESSNTGYSSRRSTRT